VGHSNLRQVLDHGIRHACLGTPVQILPPGDAA
jgi:hypothetical protein